MRKRNIATKCLLGMLLVAAALLAMAGCSGEKENVSTTEPTTQATEPALEALPEYTLYWNVDRGKHFSSDGSPVEARKPAEDGNYYVRLFRDGQIQEFMLATPYLVNAVDASYLVPVVVDENGTVTQVLELFDLDITLRAANHYVYQIDGNVVQTNSSYRYDGTDDPLTIEEYTKVYDMTGTSGAVGTQTKLVEDDRIIAVEDTDGRLTDVFVYVRMGTSTRIKRVCEHCKEEVVWVHWYKDNAVPLTNGHYYLTTDVQLETQGNIKLDQKICLDLNGHTIRGGKNTRIYSCHYANTELAIMDYSPEKAGKLIAWGEEGSQGGCVWIRYGKFSLYAGTMDGSGYTSYVNGATVSIPKNAQFDMYGGTIIGGTATPTVNKDTGKVSYGMGGAVYVGGTFNMYDGTICDGYAKSAYDRTTGKMAVGYGGNVMVAGGVFNMQGGTVSGGRAEGGGGNVYAVSGGEFNLYDGVITGGASLRKSTNGGNVTIATKSKMRMEGGQICYGVATLYGGNLRVDGTMDMIGGQIYGGKIYDADANQLKAFDHSENVYFPRGYFSMYGGRVYGGFLALDSAANDGQQPNLLLTGLAKVYGAPEGKSNLKLATNNDGVVTKVGTLYGSARISVTASGLFTQKTDVSNRKYFVTDHPALSVDYYDSRLLIGRIACLCGQQTHIGQCDGRPLVWGAAFGTWLPTVSGNYYLAGDMTLTKQYTVPKDTQIVIDLNGCTVSAPDRVIGMNEAATLTITDSVGTGSIYTATDTKDNGMVVNVNHAEAVLNLYGGTLDGSGIANGNNGAAINIAGTMHMYGGSVLGGTGVNGGAVRVSNENAVLELTGGTIVGGTAQRGGAIFNAGTIRLHGGAVDGGSADNGGAIYNTGDVFIHGGTVTGGTVSGQGSAIYSGGYVKMSGGTVTRGEYLKAAVVYQKGENALFEITGGVLDGTKDGSGAQMGAITAWSGSTVTVNGGTVQGNPKSLYAYSATVNIHAGTVDGNQLYISGDIGAKLPSTVNITGGNVPKEIYLRYGNAFLSGSPVLNGFNCYDAEQKITIGTLTEGADVPVKALSYQNQVHPNYTLTDVNSLVYMHEATNTYALSWEDGKGLWIGMEDDNTRMACAVCAGAYLGCEHTQQVEYTGVDALPTESGHYFLTESIKLTGQWAVPQGTDIVLDLNGKTIESTKRAIALNKASKLTITDSRGGGAVVAKTATKDNGMVLNVNHVEAVVTMYAGTLNGSGVTNGNNGVAVNVAGTFRLYDGSIIGGKGATGGCIRVNNAKAVFEMYGGRVYGGKTSGLGHNLYIRTCDYVRLAGGQIAGGVYYEAGVLKLEGNLVIDNALTAQFGADLYVPTYSLKMPTKMTAELSGTLTAQARIVMSLAGSSVVVRNVTEQSQCEQFFLTDTECVRTYDPEAKTLTLTAKE